jgi:hypothetical protein
VLDAARHLDDLGEPITAPAVADHPVVECGRRQVRTHLRRLADAGVFDREYDGHGYVYLGDHLHRVNDAGEAELPPVDLDGLDGAGEAACDGGGGAVEVARSIVYTWDFHRSPSPNGRDDDAAPTETGDGPAYPGSAAAPGPPTD